MKTIDIDARRYAWCRGQAIWIMGPPVAQWMEDMEGAAAEGQDGLVRYCARQLGEACAVMIALAGLYEKPMPAPPMRGAWALERLEGHPLRDECWRLMRGSDSADAAELIEASKTLVQEVRAVVGHVPDPLTPEGYFPALGLARDWLKLLDAVGEEGFLPKEWTKR
jgi:hypothetical protein